MLKTRVLLVALGSSLAGCDAGVEHAFPREEMTNAEYEAEQRQLAARQAAVETRLTDNAGALQLGNDLIQRCHAYMDTIHTNMNTLRPQHLPEWQAMYDALVDPAFTTDPNLRLAGEQTNAFRQAQAHGALRTAYETTADEVAQNIHELDLHDERLASLDRNMAELNRTVDGAMARVNERLKVYDGRITAVENRVDSLDLAFRELKSEIGPRLTAIESQLEAINLLLQQYNLADMDRRIGLAEAWLQEHEKRIGTNETEILRLDQAINGVDSELQQTKVNLSRTNSDLKNLEQLVEFHHPP